jgi:hypothetical protein
VRVLHERDGRRSGGGHRAAAGGVEPGGDDALAVNPERDADEVAAGSAAGAAIKRTGRAQTAPGRVFEVLAEQLHER